MGNGRGYRPHLRVERAASAIEFRGRQRAIDASNPLPSRNHQAHAAALRYQLQELQRAMPSVAEAQRQIGLDVENGLIVEFQSEPAFQLAYDSLDLSSRGIELLAVTSRAGTTTAAVFVPDGELEQFVNRVERYAQSALESDRPRHQNLIATIAAIRAAAVESLWTDPYESLPPPGEAVWWEVWLRKSDEIDFVEFARTHASQLGIEVGPETGNVLDRRVVLIRATREALSAATRLLTGIAEIRSPQANAEFFTSLPVSDQRDWMASLASRIVPAGDGSPYICILDTGVNHEHALLRQLISRDDVLTYNPAWAAADREGHGTEMAGIAGMGDLTPHLAGSYPVRLVCRLESSKIFDSSAAHAPHLYGAVTRSGVAVAEIANAHRSRVFLCAVTAEECDGTASEWSATVDALASGAEDESRRLFVFAAGNADPNKYNRYPSSNLEQWVENPGQAWNALVVGATTFKYQIDAASFPGVVAVATHGGLSPTSRTSVDWGGKHRKPDVVLEGGNVGVNPSLGWHYEPDSLQVLTTGRDLASAPLVATLGTSPASALGAHLAAAVANGYPDLWPEAIRALIIHSADWTPQMRAHFSALPGRRAIDALLSVYGYGVPDHAKLMWSVGNSLTLIVQDELQPFERRGSEIGFNEMHFHDLPWPRDVLEGLGEAPVEMRVTLSYFVEPSPGRRGPATKFRYASHGLRFDLRRQNESPDDFLGRINAAMDEPQYGSASDSSEWAIGAQLRNKGSVHSDRWTGTAAELASRDRIAVYPVSGWWRYRKALQKYERMARYALVISISTPDVTADLYTPIASAIQTQVRVPVSV